ncbi:MAG TPA: hypothetical protein VKR52_18745 [Terracidiphilus sp.]|nr:hypothetical protein [Terracidiphilus sp.]
MARFASLFGSSAKNEEPENSELELRRRIDERIEQALADAIIGIPVAEKEPEIATPEAVYWLDTICHPAA